MTTTRKASKNAKTSSELISAGTVARVTDKHGAFLGYLVKSDSKPNTYYELTWHQDELRWHCSCPATKPCKHIKAVCEVCKARRELGKTQPCPCEDKEVAVAVPATNSEIAAIFVSDAHATAALHIAPPQSSMEAKLAALRKTAPRVIEDWDEEAKRREEAPLNPGRAFSILR